MKPLRKSQLAQELREMGERFWDAEANICKTFFSRPRTPDEHAQWLKVQVFKEMYGSGLAPSEDGIIRGMLDTLSAQLSSVQGSNERQEYERNLNVLREEYSHFRLFADALETASGNPVRNEDLSSWQIDEDRQLQRIRQSIRRDEGQVGTLAIGFTEGGGSSLFAEGRNLDGDGLALQIAAACDTVYHDELEHGEHGALELEKELNTEGDWKRVSELVTLICQQRLRMRYAMFGLIVDETQIASVTRGDSDPAR